MGEDPAASDLLDIEGSGVVHPLRSILREKTLCVAYL